MSDELVKPETTSVAQTSVFDLAPRNFKEVVELCEYLANSTMVPKQYLGKPGDVLIAIQYGAEIGLKPLQALQGICTINGRPTVWGDAALAVVMNSGTVEEIREMTTDEIKEAGKAVFFGKRKGRTEPIIREFSFEDAKKAHLMAKQTYQEYGERMLLMRARSWGLRDGWPDVLKGMQIREEVNDIPANGETESRFSELKRRLLTAKEQAQRPAAKEAPKEASRQEPPPPKDEPKGEIISQAQRKRFFALCNGSKIPQETIRERLAQYRYSSSSEIRTIHYQSLCDWAQSWQPSNPDYAESEPEPPPQEE